MKKSCPTCGKPVVSLWRLLSLGGLRRAICSNCGASIALSALSSFVLLALGTWIPVAGAILGAVVGACISTDAWLIGAVAGLAFSGTIFSVMFFRGAKLIVT